MIDLPPFSRQIEERIISAIRAGHLYRSAAQSAGIDFHSFEIWLERGRGGVAPYAEFLANVETAWTECTNHFRNLASAHPDGLAWLDTIDARHSKKPTQLADQQKDHQ